jgi:uncharacterized protein YqeY
VAGNEQRQLSDDEVLTVLASEAKRRREAAEAFAGAGHEDRAEKERVELAVITDYLPQQLSEAEVAGLVTETIAAVGAEGEGMKAMGKVMGALQPKVKGRADGGFVAAEVRRQLAG